MVSLFVKKYVLFILLCFCSVSMAQNRDTVITDFIANNSKGKIVINQPNGIYDRLKPKNELNEENAIEDDVVSKVVGYRVQVFSDSNQRTAKSQAQARERNITAQFPNLSVYLLYKSPSWRVRVGDFKSRGEAEQVMHEIKKAFPSYAGEVTVVVDKINLRKNEF